MYSSASHHMSKVFVCFCVCACVYMYIRQASLYTHTHGVVVSNLHADCGLRSPTSVLRGAGARGVASPFSAGAAK